MNKSQIGTVLSMIASMLRNKQQIADDGVIALFDLALRDQEFEDVMRSLKEILKKGVNFALEPHHILDAMKPSDDQLELDAAEQWADLVDSVRTEPSPWFHDPVTAYLAQNEFNIWQLKDGSEENLDRKQGKFIKAYVAAWKNESIISNIERKAQGMSFLSKRTKGEIAAKIEQQQGIVKV